MSKRNTRRVILQSFVLPKKTIEIDMCVSALITKYKMCACNIGNVSCVCIWHINVCKAIRNNHDAFTITSPPPFHPLYPFKSVKYSVTINNHIAFSLEHCASCLPVCACVPVCVLRVYVCNSLCMLNS